MTKSWQFKHNNNMIYSYPTKRECSEKYTTGRIDELHIGINGFANELNIPLWATKPSYIFFPTKLVTELLQGSRY